MKIIKITEDEIRFNNGVKISQYHNREDYNSCCENVYCDFESLKDTNIMDMEFEDIKIELVPENGFRLNTYFVPCYDIQNGHYTSNLELTVDYGVKKEIYDLEKSDCMIHYDNEDDDKDEINRREMKLKEMTKRNGSHI